MKKAPPKKKAPAKKPAPAAKKPAPAAKKPAPPAPAAKKPAPRADLGAPIDAFFLRQPAHTRPILEALRTLVEEVIPDAISSIKWGMPFFMIGDQMTVALGGHKAHVNLILHGAPGTYDDPDGLLVGDGKTGRHLKLTSLAELPAEQVRGWLRTAAANARAK